MTKEAYGVTVFCDDIRFEVNGKMTLVGCYGAQLNFNGPPPGILPTFSALVSLRFPKEYTFETLNLTILKTEGSESVEIFSNDSKVSSDAFSDTPEPGEVDANEKLLSVVVPVQWSPLVFSAPGTISVRAKLDSGAEVRAGSLQVNFPAVTEVGD